MAGPRLKPRSRRRPRVACHVTQLCKSRHSSPHRPLSDATLNTLQDWCQSRPLYRTYNPLAKASSRRSSRTSFKSGKAVENRYFIRFHESIPPRERCLRAVRSVQEFTGIKTCAAYGLNLFTETARNETVAIRSSSAPILSSPSYLVTWP